MRLTIHDLARKLESGERLLGLDVGEKTVGLAISDRALKVASPVETLKRRRTRDDAIAIADLCAARSVGGLVVGLPVNMDGSEGPRVQATRAFVRNMRDMAGLDLPYCFQDERLSTAAVERVLIGEADLSRKRRAAAVDKMAAAYILQAALDALAAAGDGA